MSLIYRFIDPSVNLGSGVVTADFQSEWNGSTYLDDGAWTNVSINDSSYLQVQTSATSPSGRCLHVEGTVGDNFLNVVGLASLPTAPTVGNAVQWRWFHLIISGDGDGEYHPNALGNFVGVTTGDGVNFLYNNTSGPNYQIKISTSGMAGQDPYGSISNPALASFWHMHVFRLTRTGTNTWTPQYWIYRYNAGVYTAVLDHTDFFENFGDTGGLRMDNDEFTMTATAAMEWCGFGNGVTTLVGNPHQQDEWDAVACEVGDPADMSNQPEYGYYTQEQ